MKRIIVSDGFFALVDDDIFAKYGHDKFFNSHGTPRHLKSGRSLAQIALDLPKGTRKIFFKDADKYNCQRENLTREPPIFKGVKKAQRDVGIVSNYKGVEYRSKPHRYAFVPTEGWYAFYTHLGKEVIAGPFKEEESAAEAYNLCTKTETNKILRPFKPKGGRQPEAIIEQEIIKFLKLRGWYVHKTHMSTFEVGWPDLNCLHPRYGVRFIDVKCPHAHRVTPAQVETWPNMHVFGFAPHIMTGATEAEYSKLFRPGNYVDFFPEFRGPTPKLLPNAKEKKL